MSGQSNGITTDVRAETCHECTGICCMVRVRIKVNPNLGIDGITILWQEHLEEAIAYELAAKAMMAWSTVVRDRCNRQWILEHQGSLDLGLD